MNKWMQWSALFIALSPLTLAGVARAEGSAEVGVATRIQASTVLFVDIVDSDVETIRWQGQGTLAIRAVSYTHLDVYKRQHVAGAEAGSGSSP